MNGQVKSPVQASRPLFFTATAIGALLTLAIFAFMVMLGRPLFTVDSLTLLFTQAWAPDQGLYGIFPFTCYKH